MIQQIWEPNLTVVFAGTAVDEVSDGLGFHHLHPKDRFWSLLELSRITADRIISQQERKALTEGRAKGNLSDPIRSMFLLKKTSQVLRLGIGLTNLNQRIVVPNDKDKNARPSDDDLRQFFDSVEQFSPALVAFVTPPGIFVQAFKYRSVDAVEEPGVQPFTIGQSEVWLLGSTIAMLRGESLSNQEDAFFGLAERYADLRKGSGSP